MIKNEWLAFERFETLVMSPLLREKLVGVLEGFQKSEARYHERSLPWHQGLFFFGPSGTGKSAATRALARQLKWSHISIGSHEILNAHLFERAVLECAKVPYHVVVLEDVDVMIERVEPPTFFEILDHAFERADGILWVATSRHPEQTPKTQLVRPGRFDVSFRFDGPSPVLRAELLKGLFGEDRPDLVERVSGLTYAHFIELKLLKLRVEATVGGEHPDACSESLLEYIDELSLSANRLGEPSSSWLSLRDKADAVDRRYLSAALDVCDVFTKLIEKSVGEAAEAARENDGI